MRAESASREVERRKCPRYRVHWQVFVAYEQNGKIRVFNGRTHDLSVNGASIYSDHNIFVEGKVTVCLVMPALIADQGNKIIEIDGHMGYTVLCSSRRQFRIGLRFLKFRGNGRGLLSENLSQRSTVAA